MHSSQILRQRVILDLRRLVALQSGGSRNRRTVGDVALAWSSWLKTRAQRPNPLLDVVITTVSGPAKPLAKGTQCTETEVSRGPLSDG